MEHVAIMKKSWGLIEKILDGRKKIESRWYLNKYRPWDAISAGDIVYFKNSGEPVKVRSIVGKIIQFSDLVPAGVKSILDKYGSAIGIESGQKELFFRGIKDKKYGILIFLKNPVVVAPFNIDKNGFGAMASWITVDRVSRVKKSPLH